MNKKNYFCIKDKVVLLTGAFGLVGKELAKKLLQEGAKVIICGHSITKIDQYKNEFIEHFDNNNFLIYQLEITNKESIKECIKESIKQFGQIDILINNAAIDFKFDAKNKDSKLSLKRFEDYPENMIAKSINVNTLGTVKITKYVCKQMLKQGFGNIINVGSIYSLIAPNLNLYKFGNKEQEYKSPGYVISKSFIPNFTNYLTSVYMQENIRCNGIYFHGIENNHDEEFLENFKKLSPKGTMLNLDDIIGSFIFLCSDSSSYMSGSKLVLDGGWTSI